jgi:uncharacterized protein (DUF2141 family)
MRLLALLAVAPALMGAAAPVATLDVQVQGLRSTRGLVQACLTRDPRHFPDCRRDPLALKHSAPATGASFRFASFAPGRYALTLVHDENGNGRLDTMLGIPREGFGFSRDKKPRFGAPKFHEVSIELAPGLTRRSVRMQYLL